MEEVALVLARVAVEMSVWIVEVAVETVAMVAIDVPSKWMFSPLRSACLGCLLPTCSFQC